MANYENKTSSIGFSWEGMLCEEAFIVTTSGNWDTMAFVQSRK